MPLFLPSSAARYSVSSAACVFGAYFLANSQSLSRHVLTILAPPVSLDVSPSPKPGFSSSSISLCVSPATTRMYRCRSCHIDLPSISIALPARRQPVRFRVSLIPSPPRAFPFSDTCCSAAEGEGIYPTSFLRCTCLCPPSKWPRGRARGEYGLRCSRGAQRRGPLFPAVWMARAAPGSRQSVCVVGRMGAVVGAAAASAAGPPRRAGRVGNVEHAVCVWTVCTRALLGRGYPFVFGPPV
jgi:hypothetical protein